MGVRFYGEKYGFAEEFLAGRASRACDTSEKKEGGAVGLRRFKRFAISTPRCRAATNVAYWYPGVGGSGVEAGAGGTGGTPTAPGCQGSGVGLDHEFGPLPVSIL